MSKPEFVHYYGDWIWSAELTDWIKSLLLFFDGIALAVPTETADRLIESDPILAQPLADLGFLRNYWPELLSKLESEIVLPTGYMEYVLNMAEIADQIPQGEGPSSSDLKRLSDAADSVPEVRSAIENLGRKIRYAKEAFGDTPSRATLLAVANLSRLLLQYITDATVQPIIENENAASFVAAVMGSHDKGKTKIVVDDLRHVGIDLSAVPLNEVLAFRQQYGSEYRTYSREIRQFVLDLSLLSDPDQSAALMDRHAELDDRAEELKKIGRTAFKRQTLSLGFGFAGAAWTLAHGDPWATAFAAGAAIAGLSKATPGPTGVAYTYILRAKAELAH